MQQNQFRVDRVGGPADHVNIEGAQQLARGVEGGDGVVVAAGDERHAAGAVGQLQQKAVVLAQGAVGRVGGVEDIPGVDEEIDLFVADDADEEVEKALVFDGAILIA